VADVHVIRHLHFREGWSERKIADELRMSRKTVHKYLSREEEETTTPSYRRKQRVRAPKMDVFEGIVDQWLQADQKVRRKQRHTAARIHARLRDEYGAELSPSTVRHFVARRRAALGLDHHTTYVHLEFSPGEVAQVDWGEATVVVDGRTVKAWMFCMRLGYSTASFVCLYPNGRMEAFLDGHLRAFAFFGGVPKRIIYDNLRTAVLRILHGRGRVLNPRFETLCAHFVFTATFATVAAGWEKGLVENLVGTARRRYLVPVPTALSFEVINRDLVEHLLQERDQVAPGRNGQSVGELWDQERPSLLPLPPGSFRPSTSSGVIVTKQSTVRHQGVEYSVPAAYVARKLRLEAFYDHIEVYDRDRLVARHALGVRGDPPVLELDHYLDVLDRKPGAVRHARVVNDLGEEVRAYRDAFLAHNPEAYRSLIDILFLCRRYTREAVLSGIHTARAERIYDPERVEVLVRDALPETPAAAVPLGPTVAKPELGAYDALVSRVREGVIG